VLATVPDDKVLYIEIKCGPEILPVLKAELAEHNIPSDRLRIIAFNAKVIEQAKQVLPEIAAFWLVDFKWDKKKEHWYPAIGKVIGKASAIGADGVDVKARGPALTEEFARQCQQAGFSMHAWTVDDPKVADQLRELGYASITTNRPGFMREALRVPVAVGAGAE